MSISGTIQGPFADVYDDSTWFDNAWHPTLCFTRETDNQPEVRFEVPCPGAKERAEMLIEALEAQPDCDVSFRVVDNILTVCLSRNGVVTRAWAWNVCMVPHDDTI